MTPPKELAIKVRSGEKDDIKSTHTVKDNVLSVTPTADQIGTYTVNFDFKTFIIKDILKVRDEI